MPRLSTSLAPAQTRTFRRRLLQWFDREQRKLPWRGERDPYRILVSEIMLQQTRVAVVEERYRQFIAQFPTTASLARVREQTVLAAWSGLGYYRRARNLQAAAKKVEELGAFPRSAESLQELPGVGRYTAAAVASIAFDEPVAVVDGNVKRVLHRITGRELNERENWQAAGALLDPTRPGDFNQAMMELGATICLPGTPLCSRCPVAALCVIQGAGVVKEKPARVKAELRYLLAVEDNSVFLVQRRQSESLMASMWELPPCSPRSAVPLMVLKHSITVTDFTVRVFAGDTPRREKGKWVRLSALDRVALTGLARKILHKLKKERT